MPLYKSRKFNISEKNDSGKKTKNSCKMNSILKIELEQCINVIVWQRNYVDNFY